MDKVIRIKIVIDCNETLKGKELIEIIENNGLKEQTLAGIMKDYGQPLPMKRDTNPKMVSYVFVKEVNNEDNTK